MFAWEITPASLDPAHLPIFWYPFLFKPVTLEHFSSIWLAHHRREVETSPTRTKMSILRVGWYWKMLIKYWPGLSRIKWKASKIWTALHAEVSQQPHTAAQIQASNTGMRAAGPSTCCPGRASGSMCPSAAARGPWAHQRCQPGLRDPAARRTAVQTPHNWEAAEGERAFLSDL